MGLTSGSIGRCIDNSQKDDDDDDDEISSGLPLTFVCLSFTVGILTSAALLLVELLLKRIIPDEFLVWNLSRT